MAELVASEGQAQAVNLVELFQEGENGIERRRTDNLFKQLDERHLTEDEQAIIQKRVELQRKMLMEYERREKERKVRELREVCPDLDDDTARRALEACNWREEETAERVSSDPAFMRRIRQGDAPAPAEKAPATKPERQRSSSSRAPVGPRPRLVDPSQVGAVFLGRFKGRLGPHQLNAMSRQQTAAAKQPTAVTGAAAPRAQRRVSGGQPPRSPLTQAAAAAAAEAGPDAAVNAGISPAVTDGETSGEDAQCALAPGRREGATLTMTGAPAAAAAAADKDGDAEMAEAEAMAVGEPGEEGGVASEGEEGADGEEATEPNSADMSDNELHYEDDVLPVLSPLAQAARKRQQRDEQLAGDEEGQAAEGAAGDAAAPLLSQSPVFRYKLVAETSTGNVHSVRTEEWQALLRSQQQQQQPQPGQQPGDQPGGRPAARLATVQEEGVQGAGANGGADEDEVCSPPEGAEQGTQPAGDPAQSRGQGKQQLEQAAGPAPASTGAKAGAAQPGAAGTAPDVAPRSLFAGGRPRRAAAAQAEAMRRRSGGGIGGRVSDGEETASDGGDSDFEEAAGLGAGGAGLDDGAATSSGSDGDDDLDAEDSDDFVAAGSRKRRGGVAASRRQPPKRAAKGGAASSAAAAAARPARRRGVTPPAAVAVAAAPAQPPVGMAGPAVASNGAAAAQPLEAAVPTAGPSGRCSTENAASAAAATAAAGAPEVAGPSGGAAVAMEAAGPAAVSSGAGDGGADSEATVTEDESPVGRGKRQPKAKKGKGGGGGKGSRSGSAAAASAAAAGGAAISASGHTCRGRVKQKGVKRADLLAVGTLVARQGWYNAGYIFPAGFRAQTLFRSSVDLDSLTLHTCEILGEGGQHWPAPTFVVTAADRPDEPLVAKSCTGCWTAVLKRINGEIEGRRAAGEDLPPPPKTAIAGPEYFGLNQPEICAAIEALDEQRLCSTYWDGKMDREAARGGQAVPARGKSAAAAGAGAAAAGAAAPRPPRAPRGAGGAGGGGRSRRGGRRGSNADESESGGEDAGGEEDPEATYAGNRWSAVTRAERYRKRREDAGEDAAALLAESRRDNPLPGFLDPITLEPVANPAISPYGHVMGLATWKAVLAEQGRCPFTKQPLSAEALTVLTKMNIERYRSRIIQQ